ncbi:MAG: hypothetical protein ACFFDI_05115 [Promethearchaeota archaeon]
MKSSWTTINAEKQGTVLVVLKPTGQRSLTEDPGTWVCSFWESFKSTFSVYRIKIE